MNGGRFFFFVGDERRAMHFQAETDEQWHANGHENNGRRFMRSGNKIFKKAGMEERDLAEDVIADPRGLGLVHEEDGERAGRRPLRSGSSDCLELAPGQAGAPRAVGKPRRPQLG
jgi:hypothetical protein